MEFILKKLQQCIKLFIITYIGVFTLWGTSAFFFGIESTGIDILVYPKEATYESVERINLRISKYIKLLSTSPEYAVRNSYRTSIKCYELQKLNHSELEAFKKIINEEGNEDSFIRIRTGPYWGPSSFIGVKYSDRELDLALLFINIFDSCLTKPWFYIWLPTLIVWFIIQAFQYIKNKSIKKPLSSHSDSNSDIS